jgi:predicted lipoprotein with Yx(FWY)xxD motif
MRIGGMWIIGIALALTGLLAACSDDDTTTPAPAATESPMGEETPDADATVQLGETDLGSILVDAEGMTLYLFEADTDGTSTCYDECADAWPALIDEAPTAGDGVDESLLGTTEREDGEVRVTYADQPLYYFASDKQPGDTKGQGLSDVWYVVDAEGDAVTS